MVRSVQTMRFSENLRLGAVPYLFICWNAANLVSMSTKIHVEIRLTLNFVRSSLNSVREVATLNDVEGAEEGSAESASLGFGTGSRRRGARGFCSRPNSATTGHWRFFPVTDIPELKRYARRLPCCFSRPFSTLGPPSRAAECHDLTGLYDNRKLGRQAEKLGRKAVHRKQS